MCGLDAKGGREVEDKMCSLCGGDIGGNDGSFKCNSVEKSHNYKIRLKNIAILGQKSS